MYPTVLKGKHFEHDFAYFTRNISTNKLSKHYCSCNKMNWNFKTTDLDSESEKHLWLPLGNSYRYT